MYLTWMRSFTPLPPNAIREEELVEAGVSIVIYANHLLRSSYKAMTETATTILRSERGLESESNCYALKDLFEEINMEPREQLKKERN